MVGDVVRYDSLSETNLQGTLRGRRRGRQGKCWLDNVKEWTSLLLRLLARASDRKDWKGVCAKSSRMYPRPDLSKD